MVLFNLEDVDAIVGNFQCCTHFQDHIGDHTPSPVCRVSNPTHDARNCFDGRGVRHEVGGGVRGGSGQQPGKLHRHGAALAGKAARSATFIQYAVGFGYSTKTSDFKGETGAGWLASAHSVLVICRRRMRLTLPVPSSSKPRCEDSSKTFRANRSSVRCAGFGCSCIWQTFYRIPDGHRMLARSRSWAKARAAERWAWSGRVASRRRAATEPLQPGDRHGASAQTAARCGAGSCGWPGSV
jgi:hypothetical protein